MSWNRAATSHMPKLNHRMLEFSWNAVYTIGASSQTVWKELISRGISSLLHQKLFKVFGPRKCYPRCVSSLLVPMSLNPKKHQRIPKALQTISVSCNQLQRSAAWSFYRGKLNVERFAFIWRNLYSRRCHFDVTGDPSDRSCYQQGWHRGIGSVSMPPSINRPAPFLLFSLTNLLLWPDIWSLWWTWLSRWKRPLLPRIWMAHHSGCSC